MIGPAGPAGAQGPAGPAGPAGTTGQAGVSAFGTGTLSVIATTPATVIPGLTRTYDVPAGAVVYLSADGAIRSTSAQASGSSQVDIAFVVDNNGLVNGGYHRVVAANTNGVGNMIANWQMSAIVTVPAGNHTFAVVAQGVTGSNSEAQVSGDNTSVLQGTLNVVVLKQ